MKSTNANIITLMASIDSLLVSEVLYIFAIESAIENIIMTLEDVPEGEDKEEVIKLTLYNLNILASSLVQNAEYLTQAVQEVRTEKRAYEDNVSPGLFPQESGTFQA